VPRARLTDGHEFQAYAGKSILESALSAGLVLPYSCRTGRCSTCKAKVKNGSTHPIAAETGLTVAELNEGWILTCAREAQSDVVLETEPLGNITLPTPKTLPCRISHLERLAPDVLKVMLRLPPTADFDFIPGQYIDVIGPNGIRRSYSLANGGSSEKTLELHIRSVANGALSNYWFNQAKLNDLLRLNGPLGTFFLRETAGIDLIFLATGTGIAPIKAILESMTNLSDTQTPKSLTVLWGGRQSRDFYIDVAGIPGKHHYLQVQSRPHKDWAGATGYVQDVLIRSAPDLKNAAVYACGSEAMIHSARSRLVEDGLAPNRFYSDAFVCSETVKVNRDQ
jgi:CDP-4-dehydro-6-deoxyglucose reductase